MALRECPECQNPISTAADACPHCGCPLRDGNKKKSYLAELLLVFALVVIVVGFYGTEDPNLKQGRAAGLQNSVSGPRCDVKKAAEIIGKFIAGGLLLKVEPQATVSHIYVLEPWRALTIDDKRTTDNAIQCYLTNGAAIGDTMAIYKDGRTGKDVATSDRYGFKME